jgi:pantoate--beta-alanine ligase
MAEAGRLLVLELIETVGGLRERLAGFSPENTARRIGTPPEPREGRPIRGLVPTMGALHAGHAELIRLARRECGVVVVSIFVNPLQFDRPDDLASYPRPLEADIALCQELNVDFVFAPAVAEVYPEPLECTIDVGRLADHLCGKFRPGHFRGVATVVMKLFHMVQPDRAYFGEKDAQQLAIITRLVSDFNVSVAVVAVQTVRESDGLAVSSRNRHLTGEQRILAPCLYRALVEAQRRVANGEHDSAAVRKAAVATLPRSPMLRLEYFEIVDPKTLKPVKRIVKPVRVAGAMWIGTTRLIDNVLAE